MNDALSAFGPYATLAMDLLQATGPAGTDGSHDLSHILRVWRNAAAIAAAEAANGAPKGANADMELIAAAVMLHDCVAVEKNSPQRSFASRLSAARAREIVGAMGWSAERAAALAHVVEAHSFSAAIEPRTVEAFILQDADRLDAIGAIGVARCFYIAGRMNSALYEPTDPTGAHRALDDRRYALDHFETKLFRLVDGFRTQAGQAMAVRRTATMRGFVQALMEEIA